MKKIISLVIVCIMLVCAMPFTASAYRIGDTVGYALTTDIIATINGYPIPSYNVDGYTYIVVEDLRYYGFTVGYSDSSRALSVSRDYNQAWVSKSYTKPYVPASQVGQRAHAILYTDICTYFNGNYTPSYNINGYTIVRFDSLGAYGGVSYNNVKREISLDLAGLNYNPNPANTSGYDVLPSMSAAEKREINIFLSNFSEAFYDPDDSYYTNPDEQKISFAYIHAKLNSPKKILWEGSYYGISAENVDAILYRFFGETVPHKTPSGSKWWKYQNGKFLMPAADGESYPDFSIATNMLVNADGTYTVAFNVYSDDSVTGGDRLTDKTVYSLTDAEAAKKYTLTGYGTAVVKAKVYNGANTYELVSYEVRNKY